MTSRRGKGEGSIYQRSSDGRWVGVLDLGWNSGKRRRRVVYGETRAAVAARLTELSRQKERGIDLTKSGRTLAVWLDEWLTQIKVNDGTRPSTLARYRQVARTHLIPGLGRMRLDRLGPSDVQRFLATRRTLVSGGTVAKIHAVLRAALSDAERMDLVPRNVAKSVRVPSAPITDRRVLTPAEGRNLLERAAADRYETVYVLALLLGLRRGAILGLRWLDIDPDARTLRVDGRFSALTGCFASSNQRHDGPGGSCPFQTSP